MKKLIFISIFFVIPQFLFPLDFKKVGVILYSKAFYQDFQGFCNGLNELGYIENRNIIYYVKDIKTNLKLIKSILNEFKKKNVDLILTTTTPVTLTVKKFINKYKIPVIFNEVGAPVKSGIVQSIKKPGGYLTGVNYLAFDLLPKKVELFKDAFPFLNSLIFFYNPEKSNFYIRKGDILNNLKKISSLLNIKLYPLSSKNRKEMINQISHFKVRKDMGILMFPDADALANVDLILKFSKNKKLPLMVIDTNLLKKGGCISYAPSFYNVGKQSALIAEQIFKGVFPGNIPVESPKDIELIVNYREIKKLGLTFYFNKQYLLYADKVIK